MKDKAITQPRAGESNDLALERAPRAIKRRDGNAHECRLSILSG